VHLSGVSLPAELPTAAHLTGRCLRHRSYAAPRFPTRGCLGRAARLLTRGSSAYFRERTRGWLYLSWPRKVELSERTVCRYGEARRRPPGGNATAGGGGGRRAPSSADSASYTHTARTRWSQWTRALFPSAEEQRKAEVAMRRRGERGRSIKYINVQSQVRTCGVMLACAPLYASVVVSSQPPQDEDKPASHSRSRSQYIPPQLSPRGQSKVDVSWERRLQVCPESSKSCYPKPSSCVGSCLTRRTVRHERRNLAWKRCAPNLFFFAHRMGSV
jgi:hypothetical protein